MFGVDGALGKMDSEVLKFKNYRIIFLGIKTSYCTFYRQS